MTTDLTSTLTNLPKIDLHRHLEGSVRPATVAHICKSHNIPLPTYDPAELEPYVRLSAPAANLRGFLAPFRTIKFCFVDVEAIARIAFEVVEDAYLDNIAYVEFRFSPEFMAFYHRMSMTDVMDGIADGFDAAMRLYPIVAKMIVSISRDLSTETMGMPWPSGAEIAQLAIDYAGRGVVGLDLAGNESGYPPELFVEAFSMARSAGLGVTVHAGEDDGPNSVRGAIEHLGATRIGHGVRIVHDPAVVQLAIDRGVTLEVCPTSNVYTHAVDSFADHPLRRLYECGVRVTLNTDDPRVCGIVLSNEYALAMEQFGFTLPDIHRTLEFARESAFSRIPLPLGSLAP